MDQRGGNTDSFGLKKVEFAGFHPPNNPLYVHDSRVAILKRLSCKGWCAALGKLWRFCCLPLSVGKTLGIPHLSLLEWRCENSYDSVISTYLRSCMQELPP